MFIKSNCLQKLLYIRENSYDHLFDYPPYSTLPCHRPFDSHQRTSGGMGSALGGGAADQMLGAGSAAQLTKLTVWGILGFFILAVLLYVTYQGQSGS